MRRPACVGMHPCMVLMRDSICRQLLPDSTDDMRRVLDEVSTAFALLPVLSLMQWQRSASEAGAGRPAEPFPNNTAAAKLEFPIYIGDITKQNGILELSCAALLLLLTTNTVRMHALPSERVNT